MSELVAHPGWPARLVHGPVELTPFRRWDAAEWTRVRVANEEWLQRWEPTAQGPWRDRQTRTAFTAMRRAIRQRARAGICLPFALRVEGRLVGQVTLDNIVRGALRSGHLGYWIAQDVAGRGLASLAVALVCDHAFGPVGLHRVAAQIRPENEPSRKLVERLGFRQEGLLRGYLDIDGAWRDHLAYSLLTEEVPEGLLARWRSGAPR